MSTDLLAAVGYAAAYTAVGLALLVAGFWVLDLLVPGRLAVRVFRDGEPGAAVVSAAGALGLGLVVFTAIWRNAASGFGEQLLATVVFGVVGIALQALALVVLDLLTPGRLLDVVTGPRVLPGVWVVAAFQLAVAGVVVASTA